MIGIALMAAVKEVFRPLNGSALKYLKLPIQINKFYNEFYKYETILLHLVLPKLSYFGTWK